MKLHLISLCFLISVSCNSRERHSENPKNKGAISLSKSNSKIYYSIKKFIDGDTFWINDGSDKGLKIRLIGVDTPENQARFGNPEEYFGDEASAFTKSILMNKKVRLEYDVDRTDSFGRTLAYVYLEDGTFLNEELIKRGFATIMTVQPNSKYAKHFYKLQVEARENNVGLWRRELVRF
jgi:micrococcal nuclease